MPTDRWTRSDTGCGVGDVGGRRDLRPHVAIVSCLSIGFAWVRAAGSAELPEALTAAQESVAIYERVAAQRSSHRFAPELDLAQDTLQKVRDRLRSA